MISPTLAISKTTSQIVRAGFDRACAEYQAVIEPIGFTKTKARFWSRTNGQLVEVIHFHRNGSSYGAATSNSVDIRVHFAVHPVGSKEPIALNGPTSEQLRNSKGYAYHLRFNALSWSTYERCMEDLTRITLEHGLPWFHRQKPSQTNRWDALGA